MAFAKKYPLLILGLATFFLFLIHSYLSLDPDFGWHLRMGQYISQFGIPKTDPLSYSMSSFPFVDHEWLTNLLIFKLYNFVGYFGLAIIFSLLILTTLYLMFPKKIYRYSLIPYLLSASIFTIFGGVRTQVITWVLLALLIKLLLDQKLWSKCKFFLPILFMVWANLHAGFAAGIAVLGFVILLKTILNRRFFWSDYFLVLFSILATLINPYGLRLWGEVWQQISDSTLHSEIAEWAPGFYLVDFAFLGLVSLSVFFTIYYLKQKIFFQKNSQNLLMFSLSTALFLAAMSAARHIPLWTIAAAPLLALYLEEFWNRFSQNSFSKKMTLKVYKVLAISLGILFLVEFELGLVGSGNLNENNFYPKKAVEYLKTQTISGNLFSSYGWGGYLDWKLPQKKVFIDGRMPSWRWNNAPVNQSNWAFQDYVQMTENPSAFVSASQKYHITTVLWTSQLPLDSQSPVNRIKIFYYNVIDNLFGLKSSSFSSMLENLGWKKIYQDNVAAIYRKD